MKEYQLSYNIDIGDFETRRRNAQSYLEKGHKIKVTMRFRGREMAHTDEGKGTILRFAEALSEVSEIESKPKFEFKSIYMVLAPKK